jgi:hypothetical protein
VDQRRNRMQRIEQEVRMELRLERPQTGLSETRLEVGGAKRPRL